MNTHQQMLEVIAAHRDGKTVQCYKDFMGHSWWRDDPSPEWNFGAYSYRIKPEPVKARTIYARFSKLCGPAFWTSRDDAATAGDSWLELPLIEFREVLPPTAEGE